MKGKRIIPYLMLHDGQLYKSINFSNYTYIGDPLVAVKIFNEKLAEELCIVDVDPSRYGKNINFELLKDIAGECFMPLSYGGGISNKNDLNKILHCGYEKVIINSALHKNGIDFINDLIKEFGSSTIIVSIDYKRTKDGLYVFSNGGQFNTGVLLFDLLKQISELRIGEVFLQSIDKDGTMTGLDLDVVKKAYGIMDNPLVIAGGVGNYDHITEGLAAGANAVASGSLFVYKGPLKGVLINYPDKELTWKIKQESNDKL